MNESSDIVLDTPLFSYAATDNWLNSTKSREALL
jgi:hypothetical protein